ncbi:MAG: TetR/AcrR family transcriptional regulator [Subdoligranulum sp.]|nr:TetR/AcrR family transcriptional regulator [Subdoligranulum sp.]
MELRKRVIDAASVLFGKEGLRFTMQQVADALHISKKTIYAVYPSKEALLLDMVDALFAEIHRAKQAQIDAGGPIEQQIQAVIVALPEQYRTIDFRMLRTLDEKYPAVGCRVRAHLESNWEPTIALLEKGMAEGRIRPVPISVLQRMVTASIECFLSDGKGENEPSYLDTLAAMIDIIMNGIRRRNDAV